MKQINEKFKSNIVITRRNNETKNCVWEFDNRINVTGEISLRERKEMFFRAAEYEDGLYILLAVIAD
jgi:hypothetical protein